MITMYQPPTREEQQARLLGLIAELRIGQGPGMVVSHRAVAAELGLSPTHWSKIVNGHYAPVSELPPYSRWRTWDDFEADLRRAVRAALAN